MPPKTTPLVLSTLTVPEDVHASLLQYQRERGFPTLSDALRYLLNGYDPATFSRQKSNRQMTCRLPVRTRTMLLRTARANDCTLNAVVVMALQQLLGTADADAAEDPPPAPLAPPPARRILPKRPPAQEKPKAAVPRRKPIPKNNKRATAAVPANRVPQKMAPARPKPPPPKSKPASRRAR